MLGTLWWGDFTVGPLDDKCTVQQDQMYVLHESRGAKTGRANPCTTPSRGTAALPACPVPDQLAAPVYRYPSSAANIYAAARQPYYTFLLSRVLRLAMHTVQILLLVASY
jgi:hypothetical protein